MRRGGDFYTLLELTLTFHRFYRYKFVGEIHLDKSRLISISSLCNTSKTDFSTAADADNLKLHHIQFQIVSTKRKIAPSRSWRRCFLLYFLRTGVKLHFYSLGTNLRRKHGVSRGEYPLGSGFPIGARSIPVGTRFCLQSLVCYTFASG